MLGSGGSVQLARIFGIRIGASYSWFLVLFLMIYLLSGWFGDVLGTEDAESYLVAVVAAMLFFASLVLHELGHALVARRSGIGISGIDLWFFGGLAKLTRDTESPGEELRVAAAGPLVTLVIVVVCGALGAAVWGMDDLVDAAQLETVDMPAGLALVGWLTTVNAFLLVFNLIPAFPLDGGRIARAVAWRTTGDRNRATRISARMGQLFGYAMIGYGVFRAIDGDAGAGIYLAVLGWFLGQAARSAVAATDFAERIDGVTAADLMDSEPVVVPADHTALATQDEFFLRYRWPWFPVTDAAGRLVGVVIAESVDDAVTRGRPTLTAGELADERLGDQVRVPAATPLEALLGSEPLVRLGALAVVDPDGRLRGLVTLDTVRRALLTASPAGGRQMG